MALAMLQVSNWRMASKTCDGSGWSWFPVNWPPKVRAQDRGPGRGNTRLRVYSPKPGGMSYTHSCSIPKEETHAKRIRQTYDCARRAPADGLARRTPSTRAVVAKHAGLDAPHQLDRKR